MRKSLKGPVSGVSVCACQGHTRASLACSPGAANGLCRCSVGSVVAKGPCSAHTEDNDHLQWLLSPRVASSPPGVVLQVLWELQ